MNKTVQSAIAVDQKIKTFFARYTAVSFKKGSIIINAEESPQFIFHLESGQVCQYDLSDHGNKVVVNVFKPPAFFPMSWAINKTPNQYYFETATTAIIKKAPPEEVVAFIETNPDVAFDLLRRVYLGTDILLRRMAHVMGGNAKTRLLYEILLEGRRFGRQQRFGNSIVINLHVNELAARTGLTRETASRELGKMKHLGVKTSRKGIKIKSFEALEAELGNGL